eukprot:IDg2664t1
MRALSTMRRLHWYFRQISLSKLKRRTMARLLRASYTERSGSITAGGIISWKTASKRPYRVAIVCCSPTTESSSTLRKARQQATSSAEVHRGWSPTLHAHAMLVLRTSLSQNSNFYAQTTARKCRCECVQNFNARVHVMMKFLGLRGNISAIIP